MKSSPIRIWILAALLAVMLLPVETWAQVASTAGTSIRDANGRSWAYLTWTSDQSEFLRRAVVAIYRKGGSADAVGSYELASVASRSADVAVIRAALQRAERLGEDLTDLDVLLQGAFAGVLSGPELSLEERIRIVLAAADANPDVNRTLQFMSRSQPALALASGQAYVAEIPSGAPVAFELRVCERPPTDPATECTTVMARITLTGGVAVPLPAPGAPTDVSWKGARGDLNVRLIWATPDPLRAEALLQAGFQVYRVVPAYFAAQFTTRSPNPGELAQLARSSPANVQAISPRPLYPEGQMTQTDVESWQARRAALRPQDEDGDGRKGTRNDDAIPYFAIDDNQRFSPGGQPFRDGDQFYYYVVARDLLGREGIASPYTLITICNRLAPVVPKEVTVEIASSYLSAGPTPGPDQHFKIRWGRNPTNSHVIPTDAYRLYRWDTPDESIRPGALTRSHLKEISAGDRRAVYLETLDDSPSPTRPRLPRDDQKTYWYTVRAVRRAACGDVLLSGHSAPVPGVLRSWEGPGRASGGITVLCAAPKLRFVDWIQAAGVSLLSNRLELELRCDRAVADESTVWADYYLAAQDVADPGGAELEGDRYLGRAWFGRGQVRSVLRVVIPRTGGATLRIRCRVGSRDGDVSNVADGRLTPVLGGPRAVVTFSAEAEPPRRVPLAQCPHHNTRNPATGRLEPLGLVLNYTATTREHRVYSSIDDGPLQLVLRGTNLPSASVLASFTNFPGNASRICLYYQNLDSQGLTGPLASLGCVVASGQQEIPTPMLEKPRAVSVPGGGFTVAQLNWFCPPHAVERFRVLIGAGDVGPLPARISPGLYPGSPTAVEIVDGRAYRVYESGRVGQNFGTVGEPNFTAAIDVQPGVPYTFVVQAVNAAGEFSAFSEAVDFAWSLPPPPEDPALAWPARALPQVASAAAGGGLAPASEIAGWLGPASWTDSSGALNVGVLIGETPISGSTVLTPGQNGSSIVNGTVIPEDLIGSLRSDDPALRRGVLPCVLYRTQVANGEFPEVGGDVVQVSPLIRAIAHRVSPGASSSETTFLDPFIGLRSVSSPGASVLQVYLKDTQPVVAGASYRYFLARFTIGGELLTVTPSASLEIPSSP